MILSKKTVVHVCSFVFLLVGLFLAAMTAMFTILNPYDAEGYSDWDFHRCMAGGLTARQCSDSIIPLRGAALEANDPNLQGYDYYPPLVSFLGRLGVPLEVLMVFFVVGIYLLLDALNGPLSAIVFFTFMQDWIWSMVRGGMIPFFGFVFFSLVLLYGWRRGWGFRLGMAALMLLTHNSAPILVPILLFLFWNANGHPQRSAGVFFLVALGLFAFTMLAWQLEERPIWLVAAYGALLVKTLPSVVSGAKDPSAPSPLPQTGSKRPTA